MKTHCGVFSLYIQKTSICWFFAKIPVSGGQKLEDFFVGEYELEIEVGAGWWGFCFG